MEKIIFFSGRANYVPIPLKNLLVFENGLAVWNLLKILKHILFHFVKLPSDTLFIYIYFAQLRQKNADLYAINIQDSTPDSLSLFKCYPIFFTYDHHPHPSR